MVYIYKDIASLKFVNTKCDNFCLFIVQGQAFTNYT